MKYVIVLTVIVVSALPAIATPKIYGNGPIQCISSVPQKQPKVDFFDHTDAATFLAQKYCQQLFDNAEGRDVLRRFKEYSQHYLTSVHTDSNGVIDAQIDHFVRARSGPKQKLESDTDQLIESRSNKALLSGISFKKNQIIEIEITPAGRAYVRLYKLQADVSSKE